MQRPTLRPAQHASSGFSLLEVVVAVAVLTVGLLAMTSTSLQANDLRRADASRLAARNAMEAMVREVEVVAASIDPTSGAWADQLLDAFAPPNDTLDAPGLEPWEGEPSVVRVELFADETLGDEDIGFRLGMPRDLDGDGDAGSSDVENSAQMLPVVVRARWQTPAGPRELSQGFFVLAFGTP